MVLDTTTISHLATATVTLLSPYIKEGFAKGLGEETGRALLAVPKKVYDLIKSKFAKTDTGDQALKALEQQPEDTNAQNNLKAHLEQILPVDDDFATQLKQLLETVAGTETDSPKFIANIYGVVDKFVTIGTVYGNVNL